MADFVNWLTDVMGITFSMGGTTFNLGSLVAGFFIIRYGIRMLKDVLKER